MRDALVVWHGLSSSLETRYPWVLRAATCEDPPALADTRGRTRGRRGRARDPGASEGPREGLPPFSWVSDATSASLEAGRHNPFAAREEVDERKLRRCKEHCIRRGQR